MGYLYAISPCVGCGRIFSYNPMTVPSVRINGEREPVCENCVRRANPERIKNGLEPIKPLPGAYDALNEDEIGP